MKIEGKVNCSLSIYDLNEGDVFAICDPSCENHTVYMKTDSSDNNCEDIEVNAVNLSTGQLVLFNDIEKICPIGGKFVIGG